MNTNEIICVDLNDDWYIKIINNYGIVDFLTIKGNLRDVENIHEIDQLFDSVNHLTLPPSRTDQYGNFVRWEVFDKENLYTIDDLPQEDWKSSQDPICFESESEDMIDVSNVDTRSYFDEMVENF